MESLQLVVLVAEVLEGGQTLAYTTYLKQAVKVEMVGIHFLLIHNKTPVRVVMSKFGSSINESSNY